jgi:hypothetical protein
MGTSRLCFLGGGIGILPMGPGTSRDIIFHRKWVFNINFKFIIKIYKNLIKSMSLAMHIFMDL